MFSQRIHQLIFLLTITILAGLPMGLARLESGPRETTYLPLVSNPRVSILGYETVLGSLGSRAIVRDAARDLGATWIRINGVRWLDVQPNPTSAYNWNHPRIVQLKHDIDSAHALGLTPTVIIRGTPLWATDTGKECGVVNEANFPAYTAFTEALAHHFSDRVIYWEIGNEPDVDPRLVPSNSEFGCYGNIDDPYYGGEQYGRMLQAAATGLRRGNPLVQIIFGGLLLDRPETIDPAMGNSERFFEGALRAGAASSFDILAYHAYPAFIAPNIDTDINTGGRWDDLGGHTVGKLNLLRDVMTRYGIQKPVWLNETGLLSPCFFDSDCNTQPIPDGFEQAQAEHLVRSFTRAAANGVQQYIWYTLDSTGWRYTSLLRPGTYERKPAYHAYAHLIRSIDPFRGVERLPEHVYGSGIEAYRFFTPGSAVDTLWTLTPQSKLVSLPSTSFIDATDLFGNPLTPTTINGQTQLSVGFAPIYIHRNP